MDKLPLVVQSSVDSGRTQSGKLIAYYEHKTLASGNTESLLVVFLKDESTEMPGENSEIHLDVREETLNASIEYANGFFRCQIKEQDDIPVLWEMFWKIFNQLKNK